MYTHTHTWISFIFKLNTNQVIKTDTLTLIQGQPNTLTFFTFHTHWVFWIVGHSWEPRYEKVRKCCAQTKAATNKPWTSLFPVLFPPYYSNPILDLKIFRLSLIIAKPICLHPRKKQPHLATLWKKSQMHKQHENPNGTIQLFMFKKGIHRCVM